MDAVDDEELKDVLFDYLSNFDTVVGLDMHNVRVHLSLALDIPIDSIKTKHSGRIASIISEYKGTMGRKTVESDVKDNYIRGRFSKKESAIVQKAIDDYAQEYGIDPTEVSVFLREKETGYSFRELWTNLNSLLPHRSPTAICQHANRILIRPLTDGTFTDEEKAQLKQLLLVHGRNFMVIGKQMMKAPEDCKQMAIKLQGRKITGKFSAAEDEEIIEKVRAVCGLPDVPLEDLPVNGIAWTDVTRLMDYGRYPIDYNRRWSRIRKQHMFGNQRVDATIPLLNKLKEGNYEDDSEVNWNQYNKKFMVTSTHRRWLDLNVIYADRLEGLNFQQRVSQLLVICEEEKQKKKAIANGEQPRVKKTYAKRKVADEINAKSNSNKSNIDDDMALQNKTQVRVESAKVPTDDIDWGDDSDTENNVNTNNLINDSNNGDSINDKISNKKRKLSDVEPPLIVKNTAVIEEIKEADTSEKKKKKHKKDKHKSRDDSDAINNSSNLQSDFADNQESKPHKKHKKDKHKHHDNVPNDVVQDIFTDDKAEQKKMKKHKKDKKDRDNVEISPENIMSVEVETEKKHKKKKKHKYKDEENNTNIEV